MTFFRKKFPFYDPKFLTTLFSHRLYFVCFFSVSTVWNLIYNIYDTFLNRFENTTFLLDVFFVSSYFTSHPITVLLEILGGRMHGPSTHLKFLGDRRPSPPLLRLRQCWADTYNWFKSGTLASGVLCPLFHFRISGIRVAKNSGIFVCTKDREIRN